MGESYHRYLNPAWVKARGACSVGQAEVKKPRNKFRGLSRRGADCTWSHGDTMFFSSIASVYMTLPYRGPQVPSVRLSAAT